MIYYKVLKSNLTSPVVSPPYMIQYKLGEWSEYKPGSLGIFIYKTFEEALAFAEDYLSNVDDTLVIVYGESATAKNVNLSFSGNFTVCKSFKPLAIMAEVKPVVKSIIEHYRIGYIVVDSDNTSYIPEPKEEVTGLHFNPEIGKTISVEERYKDVGFCIFTYFHVAIKYVNGRYLNIYKVKYLPEDIIEDFYIKRFTVLERIV